MATTKEYLASVAAMAVRDGDTLKEFTDHWITTEFKVAAEKAYIKASNQLKADAK